MSLTEQIFQVAASVIQVPVIHHHKTSIDDENNSNIAVSTENEDIRSTSATFRIPLTIPFCEDPRLMRIAKLKRELNRRNLSTIGRRYLLVARLLEAMVSEGWNNIPDPLDMDDRQPEKWLLIANQTFRDAAEIEGNPQSRVDVMTAVNEELERIKT